MEPRCLPCVSRLQNGQPTRSPFKPVAPGEADNVVEPAEAASSRNHARARPQHNNSSTASVVAVVAYGSAAACTVYTPPQNKERNGFSDQTGSETAAKTKKNKNGKEEEIPLQDDCN